MSTKSLKTCPVEDSPGTEELQLILVVANTKTGTGKTTTALFIADAFTKAGKSVLLIDTDTKSSATAYARSQDAEKNKRSFPFQVIHEPISPRFLRTELDSFLILALKFDKHDIVIIDTQSNSSAIVHNAARAADITIVPCSTSAPELYPAYATLTHITTSRVVALTRTGPESVDDEARKFFSDRDEKTLHSEISSFQEYLHPGQRTPSDESLKEYAKMARELNHALNNISSKDATEKRRAQRDGAKNIPVKVGVRITPDMHRKLKQKVLEEGTNMQSILRKAIDKYLSS